MNRTQNVLAYDIPGVGELLDLVERCHSSNELLSASLAEVIRNQPYKTVIKVSLHDSFYYLKVWWDHNLIRYLKNHFRGSLRALREAQGLLMLRQSGFNTPKLVAYGCIRGSSTKAHSYLLTEGLEGSQTVAFYLDSISGGRVAASLSQYIHAVHSKGIVLGDFHHENVLATQYNGNLEFYFLDTIGVRKTCNQNKKLADLANFLYYVGLRNWVNEGKITHAFLRTYYELEAQTSTGFMRYSDLESLIERKIRRKGKFRKLYRIFLDLG